MLGLIQVPINISALAWVAIVPFILICSPKVRAGVLFSACFIVTACFWFINIYWMSYVTVPGYIAFCLYTALILPAAAVSIRYCREKGIPLLIAVPIIWVGAEQCYGLALGGFYWQYLAHSQYANTVLIQISDIFGATGISFLIAMVNVFIAELVWAVESKTTTKPRIIIQFAIVTAVLISTILYGRYRIEQSDDHITEGPVVAAVQSNVPQSVKETFAAEEQILDGLLADSEQALVALSLIHI